MSCGMGIGKRNVRINDKEIAHTKKQLRCWRIMPIMAEKCSNLLLFGLFLPEGGITNFGGNT